MFDTTQHLVEQVGHSLMVELHLNHLAQVGVHQLHRQVPGKRRDGFDSGQRTSGRVTARADELLVSWSHWKATVLLLRLKDSLPRACSQSEHTLIHHRVREQVISSSLRLHLQYSLTDHTAAVRCHNCRCEGVMSTYV